MSKPLPRSHAIAALVCVISFTAVPSRSQQIPVSIEVRAFSVQHEIAPKEMDHNLWMFSSITFEDNNRYRDVQEIAATPEEERRLVHNVSGKFDEVIITDSAVKFKWIKKDEKTFARVADLPTHVATMTISFVSPTTCEANIDIRLMPGRTYFEGLRGRTGEMMRLDVVRVEQVSCVVKPG